MMEEKLTKQQFVVCLNNKGYEASLELGKLYLVVSDEQAATHGLIRIVDESGEDYTYESERFFSLELPQQVKEALFSTILT
jgi:hypothetical protein